MWLFINFVVVSISRSLFHPLISKSILVLNFKGRKTGRKYLIPVSYYQYSKQRLVCVTDRPNIWWRNLTSVEEIEILFRGKMLKAFVKVEYENDELIKAHLAALCEHSRVDGFFAKVGYEKGEPIEEDLRTAASRMTSIEINLST